MTVAAKASLFQNGNRLKRARSWAFVGWAKKGNDEIRFDYESLAPKRVQSRVTETGGVSSKCGQSDARP